MKVQCFLCDRSLCSYAEAAEHVWEEHLTHSKSATGRVCFCSTEKNYMAWAQMNNWMHHCFDGNWEDRINKPAAVTAAKWLGIQRHWLECGLNLTPNPGGLSNASI